MSLFQSLKELIGGKISEAAPDLNVEELKNKAGEFLNIDGLSDQATELKDQVSESVNAKGLTDQANGAVDQGEEALGKLVIIMMMFVGRVGPLTLAFIFAKQKHPSIRYPVEDIITG